MHFLSEILLNNNSEKNPIIWNLIHAIILVNNLNNQVYCRGGAGVTWWAVFWSSNDLLLELLPPWLPQTLGKLYLIVLTCVTLSLKPEPHKTLQTPQSNYLMQRGLRVTSFLLTENICFTFLFYQYIYIYISIILLYISIYYFELAYFLLVFLKICLACIFVWVILVLQLNFIYYLQF